MRSTDDDHGPVPMLVQRLVAVLEEAIAPEAVVLFGSQLKGGATPASDVDLLVVWDTTLPPRLREAEVAPLLREHAVRVDVLLRTPAEVAEEARRRHSFVHSVLRWGKVVHCKPGYELVTPVA